MEDSVGERFLERARKHREEGKPWLDANELAWLDELIEQWPKGWGDDLHVHLYGHLEIQEKVDLPGLGITIDPEKSVPEEGSAGFVFRAPYAYVAKVRVSQRDRAGLLDGINRVEKLLSAWRMTDWGGAAIKYWCHFCAGGYGVESCLNASKLDDMKRALSSTERYTDRQQALIYQAAWWLRQCEIPIYNDPNPSVFAKYLSYWNAFESLTEAVCDKWKPAKLTMGEKNKAIQNCQATRGLLTTRDIDTLYNEVVNPGLPGSVKHALAICFGVVGNQYYAECFAKQPRNARLYQVRNDIAHGNIVEYDLETRLRVERAHPRLWIIVTNMLALLTQQSIALDKEVNSCYTCANLSQSETCKVGLLPDGERYWRFACRKYEPGEPD